MLVNLFRLLLIVICVAVGYYIGPQFGLELNVHGAIAGVVAAVLIISLEKGLKGASLKELGIATSGLIMGLAAANLLSIPFYLIPIGEMNRFIVPLGLNIMLGYLGVIMSLERKADFTLLPFFKGRAGMDTGLRIIDTSVIIDGRIADISRTGFLGGSFVIPRFVLRELHAIADCPDSLKRKRGRRGLEILNKMQKDPKMNVAIEDMDFPDVDGVDSKLVKLGKVMDAEIVTNDYNLNRIAELEGVRVLNINELANAMKPVVLPGEIMAVKIVKEGKEHSQGVGYLDDGTMVVVENARKSTGLTVDVAVTSVLQTSAGKMIFAQLRGVNE
jgi:uncharacterized protein YacL